MILSNVNIGSGPSAGDGDPLRSAFTTINNNFQLVTNNVNALTNSVTSVAGRTGNVILTINDIVGLSSAYASQANITTANLAMRGYVDSKITANIALLINAAPSTLDTIRELADAIGDDPNFAVNVALSVSSANTKMRGYVDGQITAANAGVIAANLGIIGYIDQANTIQSGQVGAANLAIIAANLGMKGYVDSVATSSIYSNVNVKAYTETMGFQNFGNVNVAAYVTTANSAIIGYIDLANTIQSAQVGAANLAITAANVGMKGYVDSVASQSIYGNGNVKSYLTGGFDGNIIPSANVTYSLGSLSNQWKDLWVSNNTIYLGGVPVSVSGGNLTVNGNAVGGTNLATYSGNVGASSITLDSATGPVGDVKVLNGGNGFTMFGFFAGAGGSGSGLSVVPQGSSLFDPVQFNTRGTGYRVGDVITIVNTNEGNGYSNASVVVTSLQNQPAPSIFVGNSAYKFGADGNIVLPAGGGILDSTGASVLGSGYSNVRVATYLPTYSGNIANVRLEVSGVLTFSDGTTQTTAASGGGSNYGNANVTAYTVSMGFTNFSNVNVSALITTNGLTNYSNVNAKVYAETMGYQNFGNVNVAAYVTTANSAIIGYIDLANTIQSAQVGAANLAIVAANLGMKGYVDSVASQSIYGNGNVKSYLTQFDGNIVPSADVTYSLGNVTNRWKDLYLSGNTIFLGDSTITTSGAGILVPVTRQLFSQSFLPGGTNSAATFTLDRLPTAGSNRTVLVIGVQGPGTPAPSYTLTEGVDFTISGLSLIITASYTATNISCEESYSDTGDLITATTVATDTITPTSGDLTVSGNITVDGDLYVSPTSIYMGGLRISAADGNLKVNTAVKFSDDSVQNTAYSNVNLVANLRVSSVIVGNLTVLGALNTTLNIGNSFVSLATNNIGNTNDIGFYGQYSVGQGNVYTGLAYTASDGMYRLFSNLTPEPSTTINTGSLRYSNIQVGNILAANVTVNTVIASNVYVNGGVSFSGIANVNMLNASGNLSVAGNTALYGNTTHGTVGAGSGAFHTFVGNITQVTSGGAVGINTTGNISASVANFGAGNVGGFAIGYRDVPQITAANVTLISSDAGKHYYGSNTNPVTLTIPLNSSVAFGNGTAISIVNQGTGNITIANVAGVQLYLAGNTTGGSRTLTSYGMATLIKVHVNTWFINGTGVV